MRTRNITMVFLCLIIIIGITACTPSRSEKQEDLIQTSNQEKTWSYEELQQAIQQMLALDEWHFVVRADDHTKQSAYYVGSLKGDMLELSGRFNGKDFWIKSDQKLVIEAENLKKELSPEETGMISPADHLKFILQEIASAEKSNRFITIDDTFYDRWEVPVSRNTVQKKVVSFLGPQFSDKMVVDQVIDHLNATYILAVHPDTKQIKEMQLKISIDDGDERREQTVYFRFYNPKVN